MPVNEAKLNEFLGRAVGDIGAAMSTALCIIGERLGLYKAMAGAGPMSPAELAQKTGTAERYVREWLFNQAAGGYVVYDPMTEKFTLPDEQALALADEDSPVYLHGAHEIITSVIRDQPKIERAFRTGEGLAWGDHDPCLFSGTERFFRPNYAGNLVNGWIPALPGVRDVLERGATVADIGCGHGASTVIMGQAFPKSRFVGFDFHARSIEVARRAAERAGVAANVRFEQAAASDYPGRGYDFVTCFDCLHDMGDPVGCARHVRSTLKDDGAWMIVEPFASDRPEENLNPVGRVYYAASTMICIPNSLAFAGPALGAQAGESRMREVVTTGGFTRFRRATETPFNLVFDARP